MSARAPSRPLMAACAILTAAHVFGRLPLLSTRRFDPDEFEHAHVAWSILQGAVPYRDFFEHHTLAYHYVLAGLLSFFDVAASAQPAFDALFAARLFSWATAAALLAVTFLLARRLRDRATAWIALALAAGSMVLSLRAIEIRPDALACVWWIGSLAALHNALARGTDRAPTRLWFTAAGALVGVAVLTSQKLLMAGPPLAVLLAWYAASSRFGDSARRRAMDVLSFSGAVVAVWGLAFGFFAVQGAGGAFVQLTLLENLKWRAETSVGTMLAFVTQYDPWFFALAAGGVAVLAEESLRDRERRTANITVLVPALGLFGGLFVMPVPYAQYCLTFIPLFAIAGAAFIVRGVAAAAGAANVAPVGKSLAAGAAACAVVAGISLANARPVLFHPLVYPVLLGVAALLLTTARLHRRPAFATATVLMVLAAVPLQATRWMRALGDQGQFAELRFVLASPPDTVVLDGWSGYGVFRPHAFYHWMLHPGVRAMLPPEVVRQMVADLDSARVAPAVVVLDDHLRAFSAELAGIVEAKYSRAGRGDIYVRVAHPASLDPRGRQTSKR